MRRMRDWVVHCFENYAVFTGRAARPEYWWFYLFNVLIVMAIYVLTLGQSGLRAPLVFFLWAFTFVPHLAVASRRLHDTGHSFWWALAPVGIVAVPIAALGLTKAADLRNLFAAAILIVLLLASLGYAIWLLILLCRQSDAGPNRYGDPAPTTPG